MSVSILRYKIYIGIVGILPCVIKVW